MSADLLGDENDQRLDPNVAATMSPEDNLTQSSIDGVDGAGEKYPDIGDIGGVGGDTQMDSSTRGISPSGAQPDEITQFESSFPALEGEEVDSGVLAAPAEPTEPAISSAPSALSVHAATAPKTPVSAPLFSAKQDSEPESEAVREWGEKRASEIATRDAASEKEKEDIRLKAERAIDSFYKDYNTRKETKIKENKQEEEKFMNERTDGLGKGTTWERICGLLDVDNPHNKQLNRKDMYRFKEVLMGLRKQGDRAPGAAGY
ncbi:hypothetical protein E3P77_02773 [Wallemia ichthyophaga]|nr:hypothetical protein E3P77_02773 [Wallemia ichthyophaga]